MKLEEMFPSRFVRGEDLQGQDVTVTIARIQSERMRPNPQSPELQKFVIYTVEGKKGVVLSKTLASQIAQALGSDDSDDWTDMKVTLYPEPMTVAGVQRIAIRARKSANDKQ